MEMYDTDRMLREYKGLLREALAILSRTFEIPMPLEQSDAGKDLEGIHVFLHDIQGKIPGRAHREARRVRGTP